MSKYHDDIIEIKADMKYLVDKVDTLASKEEVKSVRFKTNVLTWTITGMWAIIIFRVKQLLGA